MGFLLTKFARACKEHDWQWFALQENRIDSEQGSSSKNRRETANFSVYLYLYIYTIYCFLFLSFLIMPES